MKSSRLIALLFLLPLIALWGCTGDTGPAGVNGSDGAAGADGTDGTDGTDGIDGNVTCLDCHNTDTQNSISLQYDRSQHALGEFVDYAGGRASCAKCHSGNGYIEWAETGAVDGNIMNPTPFYCNSCHEVHTTFEATDYALRESDPVVWIADDTMTYDIGDNSNVCAWCHQSRRAEPNISDPGDTFEITSTHYGPHHGAMANVYAGELFAEIPGSMAYPTTPFGHQAADVTCVACHMADYADGEGGHTWWPSQSYCTECHSSATDFDIGLVQTATAAQLETLRGLLEDAGVIEWVVEDEAWEPVVGTYPMAQAQAFFNWIGLTEDRSLGVHNPPYVRALLTNSIEVFPTP